MIPGNEAASESGRLELTEKLVSLPSLWYNMFEMAPGQPTGPPGQVVLTAPTRDTFHRRLQRASNMRRLARSGGVCASVAAKEV